jgi:hypothetical protein
MFFYLLRADMIWIRVFIIEFELIYKELKYFL